MFIDADARFDFIQFLDLLTSHLRDLLPPHLEGVTSDSHLTQSVVLLAF